MTQSVPRRVLRQILGIA